MRLMFAYIYVFKDGTVVLAKQICWLLVISLTKVPILAGHYSTVYT